MRTVLVTMMEIMRKTKVPGVMVLMMGIGHLDQGVGGPESGVGPGPCVYSLQLLEKML